MIHFLTPEYPPRLGGVGDYTHQISTALARAGEPVHVWGPAGSLSEPGSAIVVHPELGCFDPADLRRTSTMLDAYPSPRRLIVQWVPHGYRRRAMNVPFCLWLWRRSIAGDSIELIVHEPFVEFGGGIRQSALAAVQRAMTLIVMSAARRVWVTTSAWTPLLQPYLSGRGISIQWLPVPSNLPAADTAATYDVRTRYVHGTDGLVGHFGTYGSLVTPLLDNVMTLAADAHRSMRFLLIGSGSEAFRSQLVSRTPTLADRVAATGPLSATDLAAHVAACDVLLQPYPDGITSRRTTAMAGLFERVPVVTTSGKLTEAFWQQELAVKLARVDDARGSVQQLLGLLTDPVERRRQADAGRAFYDRWFDVRHTVAAIAGAM
jgi:glycosyltransferase involved in cell wall biosynthesis